MTVEGVGDVKGLPSVSRETCERLEIFIQELQKWTKKINLISKSTTYDISGRHIADSLQIWPYRHSETDRWADLGSGGGLPAVPIAILAKQDEPDIALTLVESDHRKSVFLRHVSGLLDLDLDIRTERIEACAPLLAHTISARALAPLPRLLNLSAPHATHDTTFLFLKGRTADAELTEARKFWTFDLTRIPSVTDPEAVLLKIGALRRV